MGAITAAMVKELRELTGAGMMDSKKALAAVEGDMEKAIEFLREKGLAGAQKKASRIAADFVAKNEKFRTYVGEVAQQALNTDATDLEGFLAEPWTADPSLTVKEELSSMISVIGEKLDIRRFRQLKEENGFVESYVHAGGKIGVLLAVETDVVNDAVKEMAKNVAMQVAALKPLYTSDAEVDADYLEKEKEILAAQIKNDPKMANKPEKVIEGAVQGRLQKELKEICLLDQVYVKAEDGKQNVASYVASVAKANQAHITIKTFVRYETGEGLEHKSENFAEEVAKQMKG